MTRTRQNYWLLKSKEQFYFFLQNIQMTNVETLPKVAFFTGNIKTCFAIRFSDCDKEENDCLESIC